MTREIADVPGAVRRAVAELGPCLVLMIGAAGSGKSSLARQIAAADSQVLSSDCLRRVVSGNPNDQDATAEAMAGLHLLAEARLRRGLTTIVDATNVEAAARLPLISMARRHGVPVLAVVMTTPLGECLTRNARRPGPAPGARWGRRVPEPALRAQYLHAQRALPLLASEGSARVIFTSGQPENDQNGAGQ